MTDTDMKLLEEAQNATYDSGKTKYWYASAYVLIANTGMRSGEALALTWDKVNLTKGTITISQNASMVKRRDGNTEGSTQIITSTKTRSGTRQIPLNSKALAALVHLKQLQEECKIKTNFVICTATGKMVVQSSFFRIFQNMQKSLSIQQPVTIHALRHTFATHLIAAKVDIKVVSQLLGHSSVKITYDTYVHTDLSRAFSAVKTLE